MDRIDRILVRALAADGRATFQALADEVGLSRTATRARVGLLLEQGMQVRGVVAPQLRGQHVAATVFLDAAEAAMLLADLPAPLTAACSAELMDGGQFTAAVDLRTADAGELGEQLDLVRGLPQVRATDPIIHTAVLRDGPRPLGCGLTVQEVDETDWSLLRLLEGDGRLPYTHLATVVGLSQAATRARVVRLLNARALTVRATPPPGSVPALHSGFALAITGPATPVIEQVEKISPQELTHLAIGSGRYPLTGRLRIEGVREQEFVRAHLRDIPGVSALRTWQIHPAGSAVSMELAEGGRAADAGA